MIDPSDLATGVLGSIIHDKIKGEVQSVLGDHLPSLAASNVAILKELQKLNTNSSNIDTPDIIDYFNSQTNTVSYLVDNYHDREHILIFSPVGTTLTASIMGLPLLMPFALARGWTTLDLPIGSTLTIASSFQNLIVFSQVARGSWLT